MADDDKDSKTEAPTGKRLSEARKKGQVAMSREVNTWLGLMATAAIVLLVLPSTTRPLLGALRRLVEQPHQFLVGGASTLQATLVELVTDAGLAVALPFAILIIVAIAGHVMQVGLLVTTEKLKFNFAGLSPVAGLKRIISPRGAIEFGKGLAKIAVVALIAIQILRSEADQMALLPTADLADLLPTIVALVGRLLKGTLIAVTAIAIIDFAYQKYSFMQSMKMSKQEIKDEHKQSEGDPHMKARVRAIRIGRSRKRMMAAVPGASVVITNPTHFAVALKYDISMMSAPIVVAKGADFIAARIRALAEEHGVPLIENPPVARALYATVELDQEIPPEHYKAVAEIISFVMKLKRPGDGARPVNSR